MNPTLICDNKKDIDCIRAHHDFTALSELNQVTVLFFFIDCILLMCTRCMLCQENILMQILQLLALGGKDGFLHFWMISVKDAIIPFAEKKRDFLSEKLFYAKRQLSLGSGEITASETCRDSIQRAGRCR